MENVSNDWIDSVAIKDYLDAVVNSRQLESKLARFGDCIDLIIHPEEIHVHKGICEMAAAVAVELKEEDKRQDSFYLEHIDEMPFPFEYSFIYNGIRFFQLMRERFPGYENV